MERINFTFTNKLNVLEKLELVEEGKLKNAAVVFFSGMPLLQIQMAVFATNEKRTFNDIDRGSGSIPELIAIGEEYIRKIIRWRVVFDGSMQRKEIPEVPIEAIREALMNSFCHRDYKSTQYNEIAIYSDRIEIYNPGTFPEGYTPEEFIKGDKRSVKRNPLVADLMYYVKDIERFGTGLKKISETCEDAGIKVEFQKHKLGFAVVFYRPVLHLNDNLGRMLNTNLSKEDRIESILNFCKIPKTRKEIQEYIGIANFAYFYRAILKPLINSEKLKMTIPEKPNSKIQKYYTAG